MNLSELPSLTAPFQAMKIMDGVKEKICGNENFIAFTIKTALKNNRPYVAIIHTIKDMAIDNHNAIEFMLGTELTNEILNFRA